MDFKSFYWLLIFGALFFVLTDCSRREESNSDIYTCPMHPKIIKSSPGQCPVCGMDLIRKNSSEKEIAMDSSLNNILQSSSKVIVGKMKIVRPMHRSFRNVIGADATITSDSRKETSVSSRTAGRIGTLLIHANFQPVSKGQKILSIYSPELLTGQRQLLYLLSTDPENTELISATQQRLTLLGMSAAAIREVIKSALVQGEVNVVSPSDGYVVLPNATGSVLHEGAYVAQGEQLFTIVSSTTLRVELDVQQGRSNNLAIGDTIVIRSTEEYATSRISIIQPFLKSGVPFVKVRAEITGDDVRKFSPGQFVSTSISTNVDQSWWIPLDATLDLGNSTIVFQKKGDAFRAVQLIPGQRINQWIEVKGGISNTDTVAATAAFLVDRDAIISTSSLEQPKSVGQSSGTFMKTDGAKGLASIMLTDRQQKLGNIKTVTINSAATNRRAILSGRIVFDGEQTTIITSRVAGRIERIFAKEKGQVVSKGQPLYEIFSEELQSLQQEYLAALENPVLASAAERKLLLLGMTRKQIQEVTRTGSIQVTTVVLAPKSGVIGDITISQGQYVPPGMGLFTLENPDHVWVEAELYSGESEYLHDALKVSVIVNGFPDTPVEGRVMLAAPEYRASSQVKVLRVSIANPQHRFLPGMQAQVNVRLPENGSVAPEIPSSAIIHDTGKDHVWVQDPDGSFRMKDVVIRFLDSDRTTIISGLVAGEQVVMSGSRLLDAEWSNRN